MHKPREVACATAIIKGSHAAPTKEAKRPNKRGRHLDDAAQEPPIQGLPNELLAMIFSVPWTSALVCPHWYDIVRASHPCAKRAGRSLRASSALSALGHLPPCEIQMVLESVLDRATTAHLLPLLIASGQPTHIDHALKVWSDTGRVIDGAEATDWASAHDRVESRFDTLLSNRICDRVHVCCDHEPTDVRSIASCVLLSVAARHAHASDILKRVALFCRMDSKALRKVIFVAAAEDRDDVLGALLYLYAQYVMDIAASAWREATLQMFETLHAIVGAYASVRCTRILDAFHFNDGITPSMIMPVAWGDHLRCERCGVVAAGGNADKTCALMGLEKVLAYNAFMREAHWLRAAIAADRPETLGAYASVFLGDPLPSVFGKVVRMGKPRFCEAIMAAHPEITSSAWSAAIDAPHNNPRFTLGGVRWLAAQPWYSPHSDTLIRILSANIPDDENGYTLADSVAAARNAVDALGVMIDRWPKDTRRVLLSRSTRIGVSLVSCVLDNDGGTGDLLGMLMDHLERCGIIRTRTSGLADLWSYMVCAMAVDASDGNCGRRLGRCKPRDGFPVCYVFARLLRLYLARQESVGVHATVALSPVPRDYGKRAVCGCLLPSRYDASIQETLAYLAQHGLVLD